MRSELLQLGNTAFDVKSNPQLPGDRRQSFGIALQEQTRSEDSQCRPKAVNARRQLDPIRDRVTEIHPACNL